MPQAETDEEEDPPFLASSAESINSGCGVEIAGPPSLVDMMPRGMAVSPIDLVCSQHSTFFSSSVLLRVPLTWPRTPFLRNPYVTVLL